MTLEQAIISGIVLGMMALFVWGRLRYDLVAILALVAAIAAGVVPPERAFSGFSNEIVVIVASALVLSAAVARSGLVEILVRPAAPYLTTVRMQIVALVGAVTLLSAFIKLWARSRSWCRPHSSSPGVPRPRPLACSCPWHSDPCSAASSR